MQLGEFLAFVLQFLLTLALRFVECITLGGSHLVGMGGCLYLLRCGLHLLLQVAFELRLLFFLLVQLLRDTLTHLVNVNGLSACLVEFL